MKYTLSILFILSLISNLFSQEEKILPVAQEMPILEACAKSATYSERRTCSDEKIDAMLAEYVEYPDAARQAGVDGFVIVRFVVDEKGKTLDYTIDEDPGYGMGEAAIKAIKKLGKWAPGSNHGTPVKVRMTIPVRFTMPEQEEQLSPVKMPDVLDFAEKMPRFLGCNQADETEARNCTHQGIAQYMRLNMVYPEQAKNQKIQGTVIVQFIIDETGMVINPSVEKGIGGGCDEEALRLVKEMPQWTPGLQDGKPVKVSMKLPFQFIPTENE